MVDQGGLIGDHLALKLYSVVVVCATPEVKIHAPNPSESTNPSTLCFHHPPFTGAPVLSCQQHGGVVYRVPSTHPTTRNPLSETRTEETLRFGDSSPTSSLIQRPTSDDCSPWCTPTQAGVRRNDAWAQHVMGVPAAVASRECAERHSLGTGERGQEGAFPRLAARKSHRQRQCQRTHPVGQYGCNAGRGEEAGGEGGEAR